MEGLVLISLQYEKLSQRIGFNISANPWKCMKIATKVFQYFNLIKDLRISEIGLIKKKIGLL